MKVNARQTQFMSVEISADEAKTITFSVLREVLSYDYDRHFINNKGELCRVNTYHTSHSWDVDEVIRPATAADITMVMLYNNIHRTKLQ